MADTTPHIQSAGIPAIYRPEPVQTCFTQPRHAASEAQSAAAGAGLVPFKTSPNESTNLRRSLAKGDLVTVSFSKAEAAIRRVKRLKRSVWASGHLHGIVKCGFRPMVCHFVTLTYAEANAWEPKHISRAVDGFRRWCKRRGYPCKYTWVAEIQPKRLERTGEAVVHYHAIIWLPVGVQMPFWDKPNLTPAGRVREAFWPHGMTNTERAKSGVGYLMKYLSKLGELTVFPDGLRLYGVGGLDDLARQVRSWYNLPEWVKNLYGVGSVKRSDGYLVVLETGEILSPMFRREFVPGGVQLYVLGDYPQRFHDGAYSSIEVMR